MRSGPACSGLLKVGVAVGAGVLGAPVGAVDGPCDGRNVGAADGAADAEAVGAVGAGDGGSVHTRTLWGLQLLSSLA